MAKLSRGQSIALIFCAALAVRVGLAWLTYDPRYVYTGEAEWIGRSLALHGQFAGAYALPTGPTAHCGPFYATLISLVYRVFGIGQTAEMFRIGLLISVNSLICALLPVVAEALGLPGWTGIAAGLGAALLPMHRTAEIFHSWDEPYAVLGLMAVLILQVRWNPLHKQPAAKAAAYGVFWGGLLQIAPTFLPVFAGITAIHLYWERRQLGMEARRYLVVLLATGLTLLPWTLRNRAQLGSWIFVRSNFGIELDMSNNDRSGPSTDDNHRAGLYHDKHPSVNVNEAARVRDLGEVAYNRQRIARAVAWIKSHPARFAWLTMARVRIFWLGWWADRETAWIFALATLLAASGAWFLWRDGHRYLLSLFGAVWLLYPLTYYLVQHLPRYRIPIWWTVLLSAAYGAGSLLRKVRHV